MRTRSPRPTSRPFLPSRSLASSVLLARSASAVSGFRRRGMVCPARLDAGYRPSSRCVDQATIRAMSCRAGPGQAGTPHVTRAFEETRFYHHRRGGFGVRGVGGGTEAGRGEPRDTMTQSCGTASAGIMQLNANTVNRDR